MAISTRAVRAKARADVKWNAGSHILIGDVLDLSRQHPPTVKIQEQPQRLTLHHCRVVRQRNVKPFRMVGAARWASYEEITEGFCEMRRSGSISHVTPYSDEQVFAPVKVVIAERPRPIRAFLSYEPVYPWRGILGTLKRGQPLWLAYAVVGLLNSELGQRLFDRLHLELHSRPPATDGLKKDVLAQVPLAARDYALEDLQEVAAAVSRISSLYGAERDCGTRFQAQIMGQQQYLSHVLPKLLGISEEQLREVMRDGQVPAAALGQPGLDFPGSDFLGHTAGSAALQLLTPEQRTELADLLSAHSLSPADQRQRDRLKRIRFWEEAADSVLPRGLHFSASPLDE